MRSLLYCIVAIIISAFPSLQYDPKKRPTFGDICDQLEEVKTRSQMATVLADITNLNIDNEAVVHKTILNRILSEFSRYSLCYHVGPINIVKSIRQGFNLGFHFQAM